MVCRGGGRASRVDVRRPMARPCGCRRAGSVQTLCPRLRPRRADGVPTEASLCGLRGRARSRRVAAVIKIARAGHRDRVAMAYPELELPYSRPFAARAGDLECMTGEQHAVRSHDRLRTLVDAHYAFVWRSVRRLGVTAADADDAAQHVFLVLARKLDAVRPGCEQRYLFQTALRIASDYRRARRRRPDAGDPEPLIDPVDPAADPFDTVALRAERAMLDRVLDALPL